MTSTLHCLALVQVMGDAALRARVPAALARSEALVRSAVREALAASGGEAVASAARGLLARFPEPQTAVQYALGLQAALLRQPWPSTLLVRPEAAEERAPDGTLLFRGLRVRTGIHLGQAIREGDRVRGPGVYQLARVTAAAHGGQVLLSEAAWRRLRGALPGTVVLRDLGAHRITGVDGARRLFQVLPEALDRRAFPEPWSRDTRRTNLIQEDEFVGRQQDVAGLLELTRLGVRAITVVGPDGSGKSRLIRQFAQVRRLDPELEGGVWLAAPPTTSVGVVVRGVAEALGARLVSAHDVEGAVQRVAYALADRGASLVVIDGLRKPDPEVARALETWMRVAPGARFVVSAPQRMRARGEVAYTVGPLRRPRSPTDRHADALRLFTSRARAVSATFEGAQGPGVVELLDAVGAHPRAIRILAGLVDRLGVDALRAALVADGAPPLLEVAWDALDEAERAVLAVCAMHQGSFEAIEAPVDAAEVDVHTVLERLDQRGWLRVSPDPAAPDVRRWALAPGLRAFVRRRYPPEGIARLRQQRSQRLIREATAWQGAAARRDEPEMVAQLAVEWPNLVQTVLDGLRRDGGAPEVSLAMRGMLALWPVLQTRGPTFEGLELADRVLTRCDQVLDADPGLQARVLLLRAELLVRASREADAASDVTRALEILERWDDEEALPEARLLQGRLRWSARDNDAAELAFAQAADGFGDQGNARMAAVARSYGGALRMVIGRYDEAEAALHDAVETLRGLDATTDESRAVRWLALLYRRSGRYEESRSLYREVIRLLVQEGDARAESYARSDLAVLDYHLGRLQDAERGLGEAAAVARRIGERAAQALAIGHSGLVALSMGKLDLARERLLEALAVRRDLRDGAGEGRITGLLGILHHLSDQPDGARAFYADALELLARAGDRRLEAMFMGWFAALTAEEGEVAEAVALYERARARHEGAADPQVGAALDQLRGAVEWVEAATAEAEGRRDHAETLRERVLARLQSGLSAEAPLPGEARLAAARVERLVQRAS